MRVEGVKQAIQALPTTPRVLADLRETARLFSTHYSTMIEGNRLTQQQVADVIAEGQHSTGRERDEDEVKGYYVALDEMERLVVDQLLHRGHGNFVRDGPRRGKARSRKGRPRSLYPPPQSRPSTTYGTGPISKVTGDHIKKYCRPIRIQGSCRGPALSALD
jgi:Fic family protein